MAWSPLVAGGGGDGRQPSSLARRQRTGSVCVGGGVGAPYPASHGRPNAAERDFAFSCAETPLGLGRRAPVRRAILCGRVGVA
eukprot:scaffold3856_cov26-Tisochrysis_lutea.AAC.2